MTDLRALMEKIAREEAAFRASTFLAPCVRGGRVRARIAGIVQTLPPEPRDFEGWGVFQSTADGRTARLIEPADLPLVERYLHLFKPLRLILVAPLSGTTWLAYPAGEADMRQRFGSARPIPVHLVTEGTPFEKVTARRAGGWWFDTVDRRADPTPAERLRDALRAQTPSEEVAFPGITPEMRTTYTLAADRDPAFAERRSRLSAQRQAEATARLNAAQRDYYAHGYYRQQPEVPPARPANRRDETRLRNALRTGGGDLRGYTDRGDYFVVEWESRNGERHTSAIARDDLTVISSGICLSGEDRKFDLQSLVGIMTDRPDWSDL